MAVFVPKHFAAAATLASEGHMIAEYRSQSALRIGLLNLMPDKKATERQFARIFSLAGKDIALVPIRMASHMPTHCERTYLDQVYDVVSPQSLGTLDGLVVTGAPVEQLPFESVNYWTEFTEVLDHLTQMRTDTLFICWAAQAALFHNHGIRKHTFDRKASGVYPQWVLDPSSSLTDGLSDCFETPVSRHSYVHTLDVLSRTDLQLIAGCDATGPALIAAPSVRQSFMFNHLEYETGTLHEEYLRDRRTQRKADRPENYYCRDSPVNNWSTHGQRFFRNWISGLSSPCTNSSLAKNTIGIAA